MDEYPRGNHYPFNAATKHWLEFTPTEVNTHSTCSSEPWPLAYICTLEISVRCFRRCVAQFCDMSEYTNQVHWSKQRTVVWKLVSRNTNRPPTLKKFIFDYNFVPDVTLKNVITACLYIGTVVSCQFPAVGFKGNVLATYTVHVCRQNRGP